MKNTFLNNNAKHSLSGDEPKCIACVLEVVYAEKAPETRVFIRNINKFFDCLNVRSTLMAKNKRNDDIGPYYSSTDERLKVTNRQSIATTVYLNTQKFHQWLLKDFLSYLQEWEDEAKELSGGAREKSKYCLSKETLEGLRITGN